jgi:acetoin utilization deacetylase AcuC-like enzyme
MKIITDEACLTYEKPGHPERPARVAATLARLRQQRELPITWERPAPVTAEAIARVHPAPHLVRLGRPGDFDADTPYFAGIKDRAMDAVGGAVAALESALAGTRAMSLLRPPGHHAYDDRAMGFCYLNQAAITALEAVARGLRVSIYDFDVHHGNGTENAVLGESSVQFVSIHQFPCYPGTGEAHRGNARNYPMPPGSARAEYSGAFARGLDDVARFRPDLLIVSAGFDAFRGDPISDECVEVEDYETLGAQIRAFGVPSFAILEGGYSDELPDLVLAFLRGYEG